MKQLIKGKKNIDKVKNSEFLLDGDMIYPG